MSSPSARKPWLGALCSLWLWTSLAAPAAEARGEGVPAPPSGPERQVTGRRLAIEQEDIKEVVVEVERRMVQLVRDLESSEPEEAERLRKAVDAIRKDGGLPGTLEGIREFLEKAAFIEALTRQERALKHLDEIIELLEARKFDSQDVSEAVRRLREKRQRTKILADEQEGLLKKTRTFLDRMRDAATLKGLKDELQGIENRQRLLREGRAPEAIDPEFFKRDELMLERGLELAERLRAEQSRVNQGLENLPERQFGISEAEELLAELDAAIGQAEKLLEGTEKLESASREARRSSGSPESRPVPEDEREGGRAPGGRSDGRVVERSPGPTDSGTSPESPEDGKEPEGGEGDSPEDGKEPEGGEGDRPDGKEPEGGEGDRPAGGDQPTDRGGEKRPGGEPEGRREAEKKAEARRGPSDLEVARRRRGLESERRRLGTQAKDLGRTLRGLAAGMKTSPTPAGREKVAKAGENAERASSELSRGNLGEARKLESQLLQGLREARQEIAGALRGAERDNSQETAGLRQEEARLEKEARAGATELGQNAREAGARAGSQALEKGSEAMKRAAGAMRESMEALGKGRRAEARQAGRDAARSLEEAKSALEEGKRRLGSRSLAEKKQALQRKLARKTRDAAEKSGRLERKLRRRNKEEGRKAAEAERALREAARSMADAARAQEQGDAALVRKKQTEALERLERAREAMQEEEKEQLARLKRQRLERESREQRELAERTRGLSESARGEAGDSAERQQAEQLDRASREMGEAADDLERDEVAQAEPHQEEALEQLRKSEEDLRREEERLEELRREQEMVSMIKELTTVKERQEVVNRRTEDVHASRRSRESRREKVKVKVRLKPAIEEQGLLSEKVMELHGKLAEERSRVFAYMLKNVSSDMVQIKDFLMELETGTYTQFLQKEVVGDVDRLLAALREQLELQKKRQQERQQLEQGGGQPGGQQEQQSLVSVTAELLMLKQLQIEVNRQTRRLDDIRRAQEEKVNDVWVRALERLSQKQGSVSRLTAGILKDFKSATGRDRPDESEGDEGEAETGEAEER